MNKLTEWLLGCTIRPLTSWQVFMQGLQRAAADPAGNTDIMSAGLT
jgi:hypothetical protein